MTADRPTTAAGRALLDWYDSDQRNGPLDLFGFRDRILAIEAEAADAHDHDPDRCDECQAMVTEALRE